MTDSCFSQFYPCEFTVDGQKYTCAEQFMMAEKARAFGDEETRQKILSESNPAKIKKLGRRVKPFDGEMWMMIAENVVAVGNYAKFSQNIPLAHHLMATGKAILAEASPTDKIWSIGMTKKEALERGKKNWKGKNLLGKALMNVRDALGVNERMDTFRASHPIAEIDGAWLKEEQLLRKKENALISTVKGPVQVRENRPRLAVDMSTPSPDTDRDYVYGDVYRAYVESVKAKSIVESALRYRGKVKRALEGLLKDDARIRKCEHVLETCEETVKRQRAKDAACEQIIAGFDRKYRPFIYRKMIDEKGKFLFNLVTQDIGGIKVVTPMRGSISGADIWVNVCRKLFEAVLPRFDFTTARVGKGAFRTYLTEMAYHEYLDMLRHENLKGKMVPARDVHGKVMFTVNKRGEQVPIMVPRETNDVDENVVAVAERNNSMAHDLDTQRKSDIKLCLDEFYLAYLIVRSRTNPDGWKIRAMEQFFEEGKSRDEIIAELVKNGFIKKRGNFDIEYYRFLSAIRKERKRLDHLCRGSYAPKEDIEKEWSKMSVEVGVKRVRDIRGRILDAMLEKMGTRGKK